jgi:uncharacterized protein (UPF0332 family)
LGAGGTEAHYRSIVNRAYYGVFGHIRNKLSIYVEEGSVHKEVIKTLKDSVSIKEKKIGARLETLFKKRKEADYKHTIEFKKHNCQFYIQEAEDIVNLFDTAD